MKRALSPSLNPTGIGSAVAAVYAGVAMVWNATHHQAVIDPQVIVSALGAAAFLYSRLKVTPVADPRDGNGTPLATTLATAALLQQRVKPSGNVVFTDEAAGTSKLYGPVYRRGQDIDPAPDPPMDDLAPPQPPAAGKDAP